MISVFSLSSSFDSFGYGQNITLLQVITWCCYLQHFGMLLELVVHSRYIHVCTYVVRVYWMASHRGLYRGVISWVFIFSTSFCYSIQNKQASSIIKVFIENGSFKNQSVLKKPVRWCLESVSPFFRSLSWKLKKLIQLVHKIWRRRNFYLAKLCFLFSSVLFCSNC